MMDRKTLSATRVFALALAIRLLALPLSLLTLTPYSEHDAIAFERRAGKIATGEIVPSNPNDVYHVWGAILAPFYWLPGPSAIYSRVFVALLGAASIYFVYRIARRLHSQRAAVCATLPMAVFPSFILIHVAVIREAPILFLVTGLAFVWIVSPDLDWATLPVKASVTVVGLVLLTLLRKENLPFFLLAFALGAVIRGYQAHRQQLSLRERVAESKRLAYGAVTLLLAVVVPVGLKLMQWGLSTVIGPNRQRRARGNSMYLGSIVPNDILTALWFTPIGVFYFYFAPLPWMIQGPRYLPAFAEGMANLGLALAALVGIKALLRRPHHYAYTIPLLVAFGLLSVMYGLVEANVGAAIRHRMMLIWVIYLFGGIGIAEYSQSAPRRHRHRTGINSERRQTGER